jgi:subtilisin-like proprotein convertase family protein
VAENPPVEALVSEIDLKHTFIGDLVITLQPPAATGVGAVVLHRRAGGSAKDLKRRYDAANTPALARFAGKSCKGTWTLQIQDAAAQDSGTLASFALILTFPHPDRSVAPPPPPDTTEKAAKGAGKKTAVRKTTRRKRRRARP